MGNPKNISKLHFSFSKLALTEVKHYLFVYQIVTSSTICSFMCSHVHMNESQLFPAQKGHFWKWLHVMD